MNRGDLMTINWSWKEVDQLEHDEEYREALTVLQSEWQHNPNQIKPLIRLGFLSWFLVVENSFLGDKGIKVEEINEYSQLVSELLIHGQQYFSEDPDFLWIFGYMIHTFPEYFGTSMENTEKIGAEMIEKAHRLRPDDKIIELVHKNKHQQTFSKNDYYMKRLYRDVSKILPLRFRGQGELQRYFRFVLDEAQLAT
jgi:hypothetical protein